MKRRNSSCGPRRREPHDGGGASAATWAPPRPCSAFRTAVPNGGVLPFPAHPMLQMAEAFALVAAGQVATRNTAGGYGLKPGTPRVGSVPIAPKDSAAMGGLNAGPEAPRGDVANSKAPLKPPTAVAPQVAPPPPPPGWRRRPRRRRNQSRRWRCCIRSRGRGRRGAGRCARPDSELWHAGVAARQRRRAGRPAGRDARGDAGAHDADQVHHELPGHGHLLQAHAARGLAAAQEARAQPRVGAAAAAAQKNLVAAYEEDVARLEKAAELLKEHKWGSERCNCRAPSARCAGQEESYLDGKERRSMLRLLAEQRQRPAWSMTTWWRCGPSRPWRCRRAAAAR